MLGPAMAIAGLWFFIMICRDLGADLGRYINNLATFGAGPARMAGDAGLRHPNYRLFFGGQLISVIGTFLTNTAMGWLASTLTNDPHRKALFISLVFFASQIPLFVLGPIGGVWVDRINRRKLLVGTQTLSMLQSFALAALSLTHRINMPFAVGLALVQGLINAI